MTGHTFSALLLGLLISGPLPAREPPPSDLRNWEWNLIQSRLARGAPAGEAPKLPDAAAFDKLVVDTLRDVHNRGAELFNESKDFVGAYRLYQGALITIRPLLAHRPAAQKLIDDGFTASDKEGSVMTRAFKLHETIEAVRANLKKPSVETAPLPHDTKKVDDKKKPEDKKNPDPVVTKTPPGPSGIVTLRGQPLTAAEITVVTLDQAKPRVFTAQIKANGTYAFQQLLPPGRYVVIVTAKGVPEKYSTTTTSGLVIELKAGPGVYNIDLR